MADLYGVLRGRPIQRRFGTGQSPHYQIEMIDLQTHYRAAVNVHSDSKLASPDLEYYADDNFNHPVLKGLAQLNQGFTTLDRKPNGIALDYIRDNLFDRQKMVIVPLSVPGAANDLNDDIDKYVSRAMADEQALIYAFGVRWGPEPNKADQYFGFLPGNGIHDIHMNQGNGADFARDDGVWQDGALMIDLPTENRWIAIFLKFQSQSWHTDDKTGHRIDMPTTEGATVGTPPYTTDAGARWARHHHHRHAPRHGEPTLSSNAASKPLPSSTIAPGEPDLVVRIVAVLIKPTDTDNGHSIVTLLNASPSAVALEGWSLANRKKARQPLSGSIAAGGVVQVALSADLPLGSDGDIITLLNKDGLKVHGVSFTADQTQDVGWTVTF